MIAVGGTTTDSDQIVYLGWCDICLQSYAYRERVDDIYDRQGRI